MQIVWLLPLYLGDGQQDGQLAQWVKLPGQGPVEVAAQAAGGWS